MQFFIFVIIFCFVIFLFSLYSFAHDDFILLRKNVSTDEVFNQAFFIALTSLLFSRLFYIVFHPNPIFLNPLGFVLFPYFPGLSFLGAVVGGIFFLVLLLRKKDFPVARIFDFFSLSFLSAIPFGLIGYIILSKDHSVSIVVQFFIYVIFLLLCISLIMPRLIKTGKEDGAIGLIFLIVFSATSILHNLISHVSENLKFMDYAILIVLFVSSFILLVFKFLKAKKIIK